MSFFLCNLKNCAATFKGLKRTSYKGLTSLIQYSRKQNYMVFRPQKNLHYFYVAYKNLSLFSRGAASSCPLLFGFSGWSWSDCAGMAFVMAMCGSVSSGVNNVS